MFDDGSILLGNKVLGECLHSLVELSGVLRDAVAHLGLGVEGADDVELVGLHDAATASFLHSGKSTFLR